MIQTKNLTKQYKNTTVLNIEELNIPKGETSGLVGNNGAGKTTFFNLILDLIKATTGSISSNDIEVSSSEEWKSHTGAFIDESFLIGYLTPNEYFYFLGELRGQNKADIDDFLLKYEEFFNNEIINSNKYLRDLSKGNQKKVGIVAAFIGDPELIVLDEPFANLDPTSQSRIRTLIKDISETKKSTILISSHDLNHITDVCDRIVVLKDGNIVKDIKTNQETLVELEEFFAV